MSIEQKLKDLKDLAESLKLKQAKEAAELLEAEKKDEEDKKDNKPSEIETDSTEDSEEKKDKEKAEKAEKELEESKESLKLQITKLFEGQDLSDEFKATAAEIFEAAVAVRVQQEIDSRTVELQESFDAEILEESNVLKESLVDKVDGYLDIMVEKWVIDNELAINSGIKTDILESFVSGLKDVFESHYIDVPNEKYDLVEETQLEVEELNQKLDEEVARNAELVQALKDVNKLIQIEEACKDMVAIDADNFRALAEELTYTEEGFDAKLQTIKESLFQGKKEITKPLNEEFMTDAPVDTTVDKKPVLSEAMQSYLAVADRTV